MTIDLENVLSFGTLTEHAIFANTPSYLYSRFRKDPSVQRLAEKFTTNELLACLEDILSKKDVDLKQGVKLFGLLTSLSFRPLIELGRLKSLSRVDIAWFEPIKRMVFEDAPRDFRVNIQLEQKPTVRLYQGPPEKDGIMSNLRVFSTTEPGRK